MSSDDVHITFRTKKAQKYVPPTTPHTHIATRTQNEALMRAQCDENVVLLILVLHTDTQKGDFRNEAKFTSWWHDDVWRSHRLGHTHVLCIIDFGYSAHYIRI